MLVIADQSIPYLKGILEPYVEIRYLPSSGFTPANIREAEVLIVRSIDKCDRQLLEGSHVRLITTATIGYDHIDIHFCNENNIIWKNAPGCNAASVGQYIFSSLLWVSSQQKVSLQDKTIGIVGVGHVGREVEKLCIGYGMNVLLNDPPRAEQEGNDNFVSLEQIAAEADIVTFHTPLTQEGPYPTHHLANMDFFSKCRKTPWFINASRGSVHDTNAVLQAKKQGLISELIIDCWENEPHINQELLQVTAIATPHIAGFSADGKANATRICLENITDLYQLNIPGLGSIRPLPPSNPVIDLQQYETQRIEQAFLSCFNPAITDKALRENRDRFEWVRSHYINPREQKAYTLLHATSEEKESGRRLGFQIG